MTPTRQKLRLGKMPAGIGPAYRQWVENALRKIATLAGAQVLIEGATQSTIGVDGEQYIKVPGSSQQVFNWEPSAGADDEELIITGGSISDGITNHSVSGATLAIHATSLNYVYLECDLSASTIDSWVSGGTITSAAITTYTTTKTTTSTKGYVLLCTWQAGALVARYRWYGLAAKLTNASSGVGDVQFNFWTA